MFEFLKYIHPGNYYRLVDQMPQAVLSFPVEVEQRVGYCSLISEQMDIAYRRLQSGWIPNSKDQRNLLQNHKITSVKDNYIFLNRYFSTTQVIWVFFVRLLSFSNPLLEIIGLISSLKYKRVEIVPKVYKDFLTFQSVLIHSNPLVSVIIPTLNRYEYLTNVLADLEKQDYTHFEVIVCDQSEPVNEAFYEGWNLNIQLIKQQEKALWLARNNSIIKAKAGFIALTEDDVELPFNWLSNHLKCMDFFNADASAGVFYKNDGKIDKQSKVIPKFKYSQQFPTGNTLVKKEVFQKIGLFDRQFEKQRMGDGEFGIRALIAGFRVISNPIAFIIDVKAPTGGLRQMGSWDALRPTSIFAPRPIPSVLYLMRKYHGLNETIWYLIKNIPYTYVPYKFKNNNKIKLLYMFLLPVFSPILFLSILNSWLRSNKIIKEGAKISLLK